MQVHDNIFKLYVLITFLMSSLLYLFSSPLIRFADDIIFIMLIITSLAQIKLLYNKIKILYFFVPLFLIFSTLISLANNNEINAILLALRQYKNVFMFIIVACLYKNHVEFVRKVIEWSLIISLPLSLYQFLTSTEADDVVGIFGFGGSGTLSLVIIFYICTEISIRKLNNEKIIDWYLILIIPVFINETKITFILMPFILLILNLYISRIKFNLNFAKLLIGTLLLLIILYGTDLLYTLLYSKSYFEVFSQENITEYLFASDSRWDLGRFYRISLAYEYLEYNEKIVFSIGCGIGCSFVGYASGTYGNAAFEFIGTGLNNGSRIQFFQFMIDYGIYGSLLLTVILISYGIYTFKNKFPTISSISCLSMVCIVLPGLFYQPILTTHVTSFLFFYTIYISDIFEKKKS